MDPQRYQQAKQLLQSAIEVEPEQRAAFVSRACAGDDDLRRELESLLEHAEPADNFIEASAFEVAARVLAEQKDSLAGSTFGPYEIIREIGRGGMGAVYLARRADKQYEKLVAIKLVKRGLDSEDVRRHFLHERQILASLDHPNIARLIDGGTTDDGLPFFVMEYVEGRPIKEFCDEHRLSPDERLNLFRTVCSAVHYAHQHLVIHRDIKPGNILITEDGTPKLVDFGIAKLFDPTQPDATAHTVTQLGVMTPEYASPEQVKGENVTTASDIYSLGVLLYELLTGHRPYRFKGQRPDEIARMICEVEPDRPSTAATRTEQLPVTDGQPAKTITPESVSEARSTQPEKLRRVLDGDLDNIVLMAMRKEFARRYSSVQQFSEDILRHMDGRPVIARKDTFAYRASKFVKRNRITVAVGVVAALALVAGIAGIAWQARVATRQARIATAERDHARVETAKAERINKFLQDMFSSADARWYSSGRGGKGEDIKVVDVLNQSAQRLETDLNDQPEVKAELHRTIGTTYLAIGRGDSAVREFQASLKIYRELYGEKHLKVAEALYYLASSLTAACDTASAEPLYREALDMQRVLPGGDNVYLAHIVREYAWILLAKGDAARGEPLMLEAMELFRKHYGNDHITVALAYEDLGWVYIKSGELDKAEAAYQQSLDILNRSSEASSSDRIHVLVHLSIVLGEKQKYEEAERLLGQALDLYRTSPTHHDSTASLLGECLTKQRRYREAEPFLIESYNDLKSSLSEQNPRTAEARQRLVEFYEAWGKPELAAHYR